MRPFILIKFYQIYSKSIPKIGKLVVDMNKEGLNASQIGIRLRDEHAISSIKSVTGKSMKEFMEENGIKQEIPEDLEALVKRALSLQNHLKSNKGDRKNVRSLELLEAKAVSYTHLTLPTICSV